MIVVYPLITSKTVNPNILPGVCKALEKYIYIYEVDSIIEAANKSIKKKQQKEKNFLNLKKIGGKFKFVAESMEEEDVDQLIYEAAGVPQVKKTGAQPQPVPTKKGGAQPQPGPTPKPRPTSGGKSGGASSAPTTNITNVYQSSPPTQKDSGPMTQRPHIGRMDETSLSTEPTWNEVQDQEGNTFAIGVKVVPFVIDNEENLVKLMSYDRYRKGMSVTLQWQARRILRFMYRIANFGWKSTIGLLAFTGLVARELKSGTITKNWKHDIILQNTYFENKMFILLNKMDLNTDDFMTDPKGIKKLFGLGWTSFIVADDVNKVLTFCMNKYRGLCSQINYGFLYSNLSRETSSVYQDIEDVRKSAGPLFRMKAKRMNVLNDSLALQKLDDYSIDSLLSEQYLTEGILDSFSKQIVSNKNYYASLLKSIGQAVKRKDVNTLQRISKKNKIPRNLNIDQTIQKLSQSDKTFKSTFELSNRVFKNSLPGLPDELSKTGSALIACLKVISKDNKFDVKKSLSQVVMDTRKSVKAEEGDEEYIKEMRLAFGFALLTLALASAASIWLISTIIHYGGIAITAVTSGLGSIAFAIILVFIILAYIGGSPKDNDNSGG